MYVFKTMPSGIDVDFDTFFDNGFREVYLNGYLQTDEVEYLAEQDNQLPKPPGFIRKLANANPLRVFCRSLDDDKPRYKVEREWKRRGWV